MTTRGLAGLGGGRERIDVEALVRWAAARELPKKRSSIGFVAPALHLLADGELVGRWTAPASFPAISPTFARGFAAGGAAAATDEPHADALEVERAVLALARDPPAAEDEEGLVSWGIGALTLPSPHGPSLDGRPSGHPIGRGESALARARRSLAGLVLGHGGLGTRPDWEHEPFRTVAVAGERGRPIVWRRGAVTMPTLDGGVVTVEGEIRCEARRKGDYPEGAYCRIAYDPDPAAVVADRADYLVWRLALGALAVALEGRLERFEVLAPAAPLAPWTLTNAPHPRPSPRAAGRGRNGENP